MAKPDLCQHFHAVTGCEGGRCVVFNQQMASLALALLRYVLVLL